MDFFQNTLTILHDTSEQWNVTGEPARADGWYGFGDNLITLVIHTANLRGRVIFEGSIANDPQEDDWYNLMVGGKEYIEYPSSLTENLSVNGGESSTKAFNVKTNSSWIRARLDRTYFDFVPEPDKIMLYGSITQIKMSH